MIPPHADPGVTAAVIEAELRRQLAARAPGSSLCPSEVARALAPAPQWRSLMAPVRAVAARLQAQGVLEVLQRGELRGPPPWSGAIRLRRAR